MRYIIGTIDPITGQISFTDVAQLANDVTADVNDGSTYGALNCHSGRVASQKDPVTGDVVVWADGTHALEAISSTCGVSDCNRVAYEVFYDSTSHELYRPDPSLSKKLGGGISNTCTGSNCSACSFTYDATGNVTGCKCTSGSGVCNHTISQSAQ